MSPPLWFEENRRLITHIAEESENIVTPLSIRGFCAEYREKNGETSSVTCLARRIERFRNKIHELDCFNTEMKVKMLFAVGASIDEQYLKELRKDAVVELDDRNRIVRYERGGVAIQGKHHSQINPQCLEQDRNILNAFAEFTNHVNFPIRMSHFIRHFKATTGSHKCENSLRDRFNQLKAHIHANTEYDTHTRARMIFFSSTPVDEEFLAELRNDAVVEVDSEGRITRYETYDGVIEFYGEHRNWGTKGNRMSSVGLIQPKREVEDDDNSGEEEEEEVEVSRMVRKRGSPPTPAHGPAKKRRFSTPYCHHPIPISPSDSLTDVVAFASNTDHLHPQLKVKLEFDSMGNVVEKKETGGEPNDINFDIEMFQREPNRGEQELLEFNEEMQPLVMIEDRNENVELVVEEMDENVSERSDESMLPHLESSDNSEIVEEQDDHQPDMHTNGKEILEMLRGLTLTLDSPILSNLREMIEREIEVYQSGDIKMPINYIIMSLRIALRAFLNDAKPRELTEASISIHGFLMMLSYGLINLNRSYLEELQREVSDAIKNLNFQDKIISLKTFETVMTTVIIALSSGIH
ncbi:hypothetical protein GCK72_012071 [Caenorhabditis remanei]|uniref:SPK domain-containing protein n=1 Tax=Caenorhabditis remanei TaxID=31234 RepID=A0A6A5GLW3_CAERE|nr:hypothetical protein GCK72_012071 [Caenorhabditis remanei]KAF1755621.1 hypothetical protein GCK72_012071 [Caenorhabditis remanei]